MKPYWERVVCFSDKSVRFAIEMGLAGFELVMYADDGRVVVANIHGDFTASQLQVVIGDGIAALRQANKR